MEMYSEEDLQNLNTMPIPDLWAELYKRLNPTNSRLTHAQFCAFRAALIRDPPAAAAANLDRDYRGLFKRINDYLEDPFLRKSLSRQAGTFRDYTTALADHNLLHNKVQRGASSSSTSDNGPNQDDLDLVSGAILADCKYCLAWLEELGSINTGNVYYNEYGWSLLAIAVKANAKNVIDTLINHSGNDPGPLNPHRVFRDGSVGQSILNFAIDSATTSDDTCLWALINWCASFMEQDDTRIANELDESYQYKIAKISSIRLINKLDNTFGTDILENASGPQGENIWHAATIHRNPVFLTWLRCAYPDKINTRDNQNNTPLMYAILQGNRRSVNWFKNQLSNDQISCKGQDPSQPLPCALDIAIESWNENCVGILNCINKHPVYAHMNQDIRATADLIMSMIRSLVAHKNSLNMRLQVGKLSRAEKQRLWNNTKNWVSGKCRVLVKNASSDLFQSSELRDCLAFARSCRVGFLQHCLSNNDDVTWRRLRSSREF
ncbi:hypothetical protein PENSTE_c021G07554 [Penicillium steckii]|uniref:Uncharacterized protein n=1 Tax=Penicillium steckii TaxID=303698 RepID=A0A1V6SU83_9EURO|nr:hypothetical protein PENSTE_c021G07554 [Penicillium steckii]